MDVTPEQLAKALDHLWVYAKNREGTHHGQIVDPDPVSQELWEHLLYNRPEPHPTGPRLADADLCARCGNQFPNGQLCDPCKRAVDAYVVDAHICCEHADTDPELTAMAALLPALPLVSKLSYDARERVMDWAKRRACDGRAPF